MSFFQTSYYFPLLTTINSYFANLVNPTSFFSSGWRDFPADCFKASAETDGNLGQLGRHTIKGLTYKSSASKTMTSSECMNESNES